jgi:hypothetical protein
MVSIDVVTINGKSENLSDYVAIVEDARNYFPIKTWDTVQYSRELHLKHDVKIAMNGKTFGAFSFKALIKRIRSLKNHDQLVSLLLAITADPIIAIHYFFDGRNFKRTSYLIHDYVDEKIGVVSFYHLEKELSKKVIAHGLGHNKGLVHHLKPIDLMYPELLKCSTLQVEGFCEDCLHEMMKDEAE